MIKVYINQQTMEWHGSLYVVRCPQCGKIIASGSSDCLNQSPVFSTCDCDEDDEFYAFVNILDNNGYAYDNYCNVKLEDGRKGTRYDISEYSQNHPTRNFEKVKEYLTKRFGENRLVFQTRYKEYAPEIKYRSIVILDN